MKKKLNLNFLNKLENKVFTQTGESYMPISSLVAMSTVFASVVSIVVIFILQMVGADQSSAAIVLGIVFGAAFIFTVFKAYQCITCLPTTGMKVGFAAYVLVLFAGCAFIFIWLAVWAMMIALFILAAWLVLKFAFGSGGGSGKKIKVTYGDGSSEIMESTGRGITGETYYEGSSGRTHVEP